MRKKTTTTLVAFGAVVVGEVVGVAAVVAGEAFDPFWRAFAAVGAVAAGIGFVTRMVGRCASGNCWRMTMKTEFCGFPIEMLSAIGHH